VIGAPPHEGMKVTRFSAALKLTDQHKGWIIILLVLAALAFFIVFPIGPD
jgi:hypothetical protein